MNKVFQFDLLKFFTDCQKLHLLIFFSYKIIVAELQHIPNVIVLHPTCTSGFEQNCQIFRILYVVKTNFPYS